MSDSDAEEVLSEWEGGGAPKRRRRLVRGGGAPKRRSAPRTIAARLESFLMDEDDDDDESSSSESTSGAENRPGNVTLAAPQWRATGFDLAPQWQTTGFDEEEDEEEELGGRDGTVDPEEACMYLFGLEVNPLHGPSIDDVRRAVARVIEVGELIDEVDADQFENDDLASIRERARHLAGRIHTRAPSWAVSFHALIWTLIETEDAEVGSREWETVYPPLRALYRGGLLPRGTAEWATQAPGEEEEEQEAQAEAVGGQAAQPSDDLIARSFYRGAELAVPPMRARNPAVQRLTVTGRLEELGIEGLEDVSARAEVIAHAAHQMSGAEPEPHRDQTRPVDHACFTYPDTPAMHRIIDEAIFRALVDTAREVQDAGAGSLSTDEVRSLAMERRRAAIFAAPQSNAAPVAAQQQQLGDLSDEDMLAALDQAEQAPGRQQQQQPAGAYAPSFNPGRLAGGPPLIPQPPVARAAAAAASTVRISDVLDGAGIGARVRAVPGIDHVATLRDIAKDVGGALYKAARESGITRARDERGFNVYTEADVAAIRAAGLRVCEERCIPL